MLLVQFPYNSHWLYGYSYGYSSVTRRLLVYENKILILFILGRGGLVYTGWSINVRNDKPLKPEIFHTLKATQNKSFQAIIVNIKDFSMARYLFFSKKCYRCLRKWLNSETQEVYLKFKFFLHWFHQIGIKEAHTKFQVINFIFTGVMTFLWNEIS